jgi:hypothetical protein
LGWFIDIDKHSRQPWFSLIKVIPKPHKRLQNFYVTETGIVRGPDQQEKQTSPTGFPTVGAEAAPADEQ